MRLCHSQLVHGADVNAQDGYGLTPLHLATCYGYLEVLDLLLKSGAGDRETRLLQASAEVPIL